tara:strand:+ start:641 stop:1432 length:792 start_codon:yes stop_codon:yes gene_type:complete
MSEKPNDSEALMRNIRIVLVRTSHPGNIGGVARAMLNMGLTQLTLVAPRLFPDEQATSRAVGAERVLETAVVVETLEQAIADCTHVLATSARPRHLGDEPIHPGPAASRLIEAAGSGPVALVFGNERTGLSNSELELCQVHTMIPSSEQYSSLNLAAAVQIYAWELRKALVEPQKVSPKDGHPRFVAPTHQQGEDFYAHLERVLLKTGFLDPDNPRLLMRRLRQFVSRGRPDLNELNILRGILTSIETPKRRNPRNKNTSDPS